MIYFISDLHLSEDTPGIFWIFKEFVAGLTAQDTLYILGDFFEAWPGDDCLDDPDNPFNLRVVELLDEKCRTGTVIFLIHGNRDFLLNGDFSRRSGVQLLSDPYDLVLPEATFLLSHGDAWCTADMQYQQIRSLTRTPAWQSAVLAKPLQERYVLAKALREQSEATRQNQSEAAADDQTDLDAQTIHDLLYEHPCQVFIHGHTHRPGEHLHQIGGRTIERRVLSDWHENYGQALVWNGHSLMTIDLN